MELVLVKALASLILPPGGNIVVGVAGLALWRRARALAAALIGLSLVTLLVLSTPRVANALFAGVETFDARRPGAVVAEDIGAIVVLSGGRNRNAAEYGGETVARNTLERVRYAARLQRETGLPLLVSGGSVFAEETTLAELMRDALVEDFDVPVRWLEDRSRNTAENAEFTAELLSGEGINAVFLVTDATHMPRAAAAFEAQGLEVYAAPTGFRSDPQPRNGLLGWLPNAEALEKSRAVLHEHLGRLWYRIRY